MNTRFVANLFLILGFADLAVLNVMLVPRLAREVPCIPASKATTSPEGSGVPAHDLASLRTFSQAPAPSPEAVRAGQDAPPESAVPAATDILFPFETTEVLIQQSAAELRGVAMALAHEPTRRLLVRGHADCLGSPAHNRLLSRRRAESVMRLLVAYGAPDHRISIEAVGDTQPVDSSPTPQAWARNRRVQLLWW